MSERTRSRKNEGESWSAAARDVLSRQALFLVLCLGLISVPILFLVTGHPTYLQFLVGSYLWVLPLFVAVVRIIFQKVPGGFRSVSFTIKQLLTVSVLSAPFFSVPLVVSSRMAALKLVFFVTDRPEIASNFRNYALPCDDGIENCQAFAFGEALVLVPLAQSTRPPGNTELAAYDSDKPKIIPLRRPDFYSELQRFENAFLYTHGFHTSLDEALRSAAQISIDLKFEGAAIAFNWPSEHEAIPYLFENYNGDTRRVPVGANDLAVLLPLIRSRSKATSFDIIAHSIGSNLTAQAILQSRAKLCESGASFTNIVLGAPDILPELFDQQAPALLCSARRLTIYYSRHDKALLASTILQEGRRIGRGTPPISGADVIDAGEVDSTFIDHHYLFSGRVLGDVFVLIHSGMPASKRYGVLEDTETGAFVLTEVKR